MIESDIIELTDSIDYYGNHRLQFENFVINNYTNYHILRLPSIYGNKLKKGILFDLLNQNYLEGICLEDKLQFYDLSNINEDIQYIVDNNIKIINLVTEPICVRDIINIFTDYTISDNSVMYNNSIINTNKRNPVSLNICSKYFDGGYKYNSSISMTKIKKFIDSKKKLLVLIPLYKIKKHMIEVNINNGLFNCYENMFKLSSESYLKHNDNIEIKILENDNKNESLNGFGDMFKDITKKMLDIHFFEKKDLLYVESDTMCFNKISFENINKLLMFNLGTGNCDLYKQDVMMNSGIIYIPKNCNIDYDVTIKLFNEYNFNEWINFERFWNIIYYSQFKSFEESVQYNKYIGKYNFFKTNYMPSNFISNIRTIDFFIKNKPSIIHVCGSRGASKCLEIMNHIKNFNITEDAHHIYDNLPIL